MRATGCWFRDERLKHQDARYECGWRAVHLESRIAYLGSSIANPASRITDPAFRIPTLESINWKATQWTVLINVMLNQLLTVGSHPISLQAGYRSYTDSPNHGPTWGHRFAVVLLFPK